MESKRYYVAVILCAVFQLFGNAGGISAEAPSSFHVLEQWKLGGSAGWGSLLFDSNANLLYIPRTDRVTVLDAENGKVRGEVTGFVDARNVALDGAGRYGYVTDIADGRVGYVRVFDRTTFKLAASIQVGRIPGAILYDPVMKEVFAFSSRDRNASVIDTAKNVVAATIPLPGKPHLAVSDGTGSIFVSFRGIGKLVRIDTATGKLAAEWSTAPCDEFHGMAMDTAHGQVIASCYNQQLVVIRTDSGQLIPIGECAVDSADLAFDPRHQMLMNATNRGVLTIFHQEGATVFRREVEIAASARAGTIAVDADKGRVFLVTAEFEQRPVSGKGLEEMQSRLMPVPGSFTVIVAGR